MSVGQIFRPIVDRVDIVDIVDIVDGVDIVDIKRPSESEHYGGRGRGQASLKCEVLSAKI